MHLSFFLLGAFGFGAWKALKARDDFQTVISTIEKHRDEKNPATFISHLNLNSRSHAFGSDTPLIWYVKRNDQKAVKILLTAGADPDIKNDYGINALSQAKKQDNQEIISLLNQAIEMKANKL